MAAHRLMRSNTLNVRFSVNSLFEIIQQQDQSRGDMLAERQRNLNDLKKDISVNSKKNFTLERDIRNLDQKIALLIRNRISLEEVMADSKGAISLINPHTITLKDKREREMYGRLFYLLQQHTTYIATTARLIKLNEIDNLLQTVMFTLYGNQYDEGEEHLLLSMFREVLSAEFNEAKGTGSLLRANTALTRMMTTYTRRGPGQQYLKVALTDILKEITTQNDLILEINPLKVYEAYINNFETTTGQICPLPRKTSPEAAARTPEVRAIIEPRIKQLGELTDRFLDTIIQSLEHVPYGIRWISKQIRELVKTRFPEATREQTCSLIGGFYLLRFVNPAIVTPQAFMLVETKLSSGTRRNLTLLAKILQNLANNMQFGGVKEFFMAPLNPVLEKNRERLNVFLEELTRVDDLQQHLSLDKYIALGRKQEAVINISLNEMYFIHALLGTHLSTLSVKCPGLPDVTAELKQIISKLGPAPPQLPRKENANVDLKLDTITDSQADTTDPEQLYSETKHLLFSIIKAAPQLNICADGSVAADDNDINRILIAAETYARTHNNRAIGNSVSRIRANFKVLVAAGILNEQDNYAKLCKDAVQELINYEHQIERVQSDKERLRIVLMNIHEHNKFLGQQLDAYKEYLNNVRENCQAGGRPAVTKTGKDKDPKAALKAAKAAGKKGKKGSNFKFTHVNLEKDGIIIESEVPADRRSSISFTFSMIQPGQFKVEVTYKGRGISKLNLMLDELLEKQNKNELEYETDFLKLNVNLLIYLLNKTFMS